MPKIILTQDLRQFTRDERDTLEALAKKANMTVAEWVEYAQKAQIYHNAKQRLLGASAA